MSAFPKTLAALSWFDTLCQDLTVFSGIEARAELDEAAQAVEQAFFDEARSIQDRIEGLRLGSPESLLGKQGRWLRSIVWADGATS